MSQWLWPLGALVLAWVVWNFVVRPRVEARSRPLDDRQLRSRAEADAARERRQRIKRRNLP